MRKLIVTGCLALILLGVPVYAETLDEYLRKSLKTNSNKPVSEGFQKFEQTNEFRRKLDSFLEAAFQKKIWYSSSLLDSSFQQKWSNYLPEFLKEPSLRAEGMPKYGVINKWQNPTDGDGIKVDLVLVQLFDKGNQVDLIPHQQALEKAIRSSIGSLNDSKVVHLSYDKMFDNIAELHGQRIHIIPFLRSPDNLEPKINAINRNIGGGVYHYSFGMIAAEMLLNGAVRFTPDSENQVDGYFLPDKNNHITAAICYINISNPEAVQKKFIDECLLRSLGLPENARKGMLSEKEINTVSGFTEGDIQMLKWLYSPEIKAGDDKYEVIRKLNLIR